MGGLGWPELLIILLVVVVLFGSTRLPKLARSLGEASKEFKAGVAEHEKGEREAEVSAPAGDPGEQVTMSRAELDALLAERERNAGKDVPPPAQG
jgi:sec-independent protein translocase protein TatA